MDAFLTPQVHAVAIDEDLVLLDARRDRYLCWPGAGELLAEDHRRGLHAPGRERLEPLIAAGLAAWTPAADKLAGPSRRRPFGALAPQGPRSLSPADRAAFLAACRDAAWLYRGRRFEDLIALGAHHPGPVETPPPGEALADLVGRFQTWAPWLPAPAKCLIRSFLLLRLLRRRGFDANWVFAVRTWPFEAHCWLQAGGVVLDDHLERLVAFHPILTL